MQNLILKIQYDGTEYSGWQIQPNAVTIQEKIKDAFEELGYSSMLVIGAGRTDAGVHAREMTASAEVSDNFSIPPRKLPIAMNSRLPSDVRITGAEFSKKSFHARFDAKARRYSYSVHTKPDVFAGRFSHHCTYDLDITKLFQVSALFRGEHDFTTFSKFNESIKYNICTIEQCHWSKHSENRFILTIKADHFLYGMVRSLVGVMIDVARGKRSTGEVSEAMQLADRDLNSPLAPAKGLIFEEAYY